jgi:hypothetical protein
MKRFILRWWIALLAVSGILGCSRHASPVFVRPEPLAAGESQQVNEEATPTEDTRPAEVERTVVEPAKLTLLEPQTGDRVPQFGADARFKIEGDLPEGTQPVVFLRDATGLDTNWWPYRCRRDLLAGPGVWTCGVQYGEPRDSGGHFAVVVRILNEAEAPAPGDMGPLPDGLATSEVAEVVRQ